MTRKTKGSGFGKRSSSSAEAAAHAADLERRGAAAKNAEADILAEVPLLYGSPGRCAPDGDPGVTLARLHQQELRQRHGLTPLPRNRHSNNALPFERTLGVLLLLFVLLFLIFG